MNVGLGLFIFLFTVWKLKGEWTEAKGETFDVTGSILFSLVLVATILGLSQLPGVRGMTFILLGGLAIFFFVKWEIRNPSPVLNIDLLARNRVFALSNLAALINYSATFAVSFLMSLYLQVVKGLNPRAAGLILIAQPIMQAIFSPVTGKLSDRLEPRIVASAGMALTASGLFLLTFLDQQSTTFFIIGCLILLGLGFALFSSPNANAVMSSVDKKFYGVASGTIGTMRTTGQMFSMGMVMMILATYVGQTQITLSSSPLFLKSMKIAFTIFTGLCVAGVFASFSRGNVR
jgi:nitrate/nitrite transporter NarK